MDVTIDAVVIHHLLRHPRKVKGSGTRGTAIDCHLRSGRLRVGVDPDHGIVHEWERTSGREVVSVVVNAWEGSRALFPVRALGRVDHGTMNRLRRLGFTDAVDKLHVRVAVVLKDRQIVSGDPDFWDPSDPSSVGNPRASVATVLRNELQVAVVILPELLRMCAA